MAAVRIWIVGEGNNELGPHDGYGGHGRGVLEALLEKVCPAGWQCSQKTMWNRTRRFRAGAARARGSDHADYGRVLGLVLAAYEDGCEAAAFSRDVDSEPYRKTAVDSAIDWIARDSAWLIDVVGGVAEPALEGWILALQGVRDTDSMSRQRTVDMLASRSIDAKSTRQYVEVVDAAVLKEPGSFGLAPGTESLQQWLAMAHRVLTKLVHGV